MERSPEEKLRIYNAILYTMLTLFAIGILSYLWSESRGTPTDRRIRKLEGQIERYREQLRRNHADLADFMKTATYRVDISGTRERYREEREKLHSKIVQAEEKLTTILLHKRLEALLLHKQSMSKTEDQPRPVQELTTIKRQILGSLDTQIRNDQYDSALQKLDEFNLPELEAEISEFRSFLEAELLERVKSVPASDYQQNYNIYSTLLRVDPTNELYNEKAPYYKLKSLDAAVEHAEVLIDTCYQLGYRFGTCATRSLKGLECDPENDIVIPERCRNNAETQRGVRDGTKAVYDSVMQRTKKQSSSGSLNMITTPLDTLRRKLNGKTKSEVRALVGSPDTIERFAGKECWIYGSSRTSQDRGIVFDGGAVLTVTFY
jgi:hypothetical protein